MTHQAPYLPFKLYIEGFGTDALTVAQFSGHERWSRVYQFDLLVLTSQPVGLSDLPPEGVAADP